MHHRTSTTLATPLGRLTAVGDADGALVGLYYDGHRPVPRLLAGAVQRPGAAPFGALAVALDAYFAHERGAFDDLPVRLVGTPFQLDVWAAVRAVPFGETATYAGIAARLDRGPAAARAVGAANARNPLSIVVPCHRLVTTDGRLAGYAGGEWRKRRLLELEQTA